MEFTLLKASDYTFKKKVEVNTITDLELFSKQYGERKFIVDFECKEITIYDDYIE